MMEMGVCGDPRADLHGSFRMTSLQVDAISSGNGTRNRRSAFFARVRPITIHTFVETTCALPETELRSIESRAYVGELRLKDSA